MWHAFEEYPKTYLLLAFFLIESVVFGGVIAHDASKSMPFLFLGPLIPFYIAYMIDVYRKSKTGEGLTTKQFTNFFSVFMVIRIIIFHLSTLMNYGILNMD
jgi:hypothetical protein